MAIIDHITPAASRRGILGAFAALGAAGASALDTARAAGPSPDADLIRLCAAHPALIADFNTSDGDDSDSDPAWAAYAASRDAISGARPVTLEGMRGQGAGGYPTTAAGSRRRGDRGPHGK